MIEIGSDKVPAEEKPFIKREIQNIVFCDLFSDAESQLKLYNFLHPEDTSVTTDDFKTELQKIIEMYQDENRQLKEQIDQLTSERAETSRGYARRSRQHSPERLCQK